MTFVAEVLPEWIFLFFCILVGKCCYNDSIVVDKRSVFVLLLVSMLNALIWKENIVCNVISSILYYGTILGCLLRGGVGKWKRVAAFLEAMLITIFGMFPIAGIVQICLFPNLEEDDGIDKTCMLWVMMVAVVLIYVFFKLYRKGICLRFGKSERILLVVFNSLMFLVYGVFIIQEDEGFTTETMRRVFYFLYAVVTMALYMLFLGVLVKHRLSVYYKQEQEYQQEWLKKELQHFTEYKAAQEETRRFRHDVVNNLTCIETLLQDGKTEEAADYVENMIGEVKELSPKAVTGDEMLDCIVASKWDTMKQLKIEFSLDGVFDRRLNWQPMEICAVFANALDNAIEACARMQDKRWISFQIKHTAQFYYVEISNSCQDNVGPMPEKGKRYTTKQNVELHGYGLGNIQKILKKYDGDMKIEQSEGRFLLSMTIPVAGEISKEE